MTAEKPLKITLLGVKQSKPGNKFIFVGETENCSECRLRGVCLKLEENRVYEVANVKDTIHPCDVFVQGVQTVEIFEPSYVVTTGAKLAVEGATITFLHRDCDLIGCPHYYHHCCPTYLSEGEKLRIKDISNESVECKQGYQLKLITVDRNSEHD
ncbi:MAG: UPF0179 family protein [Candidatus Hodarchaeales archaeon]|jgi:uncharacterized protein (UPF0179 family)